MQRPKPATGEIYHVYNRGVEKRKVFLQEQDYYRFVHDLFEFNDSEYTEKLYIPLSSRKPQIPEVGLPEFHKRKLLVDILSFCLMPNHFHLMLHQRTDNGITEFMRKLGTGYTNFFNKKYERVGALFQGKYKAIHISKDHHLLYLPYYIHLNPLDMISHTWRDGTIKNIKQAETYLGAYRWSSYLDYTGKKNFPSVIEKNFLVTLLGSPEDYKKDMFECIREQGVEDI